jgi:hypothetical protein
VRPRSLLPARATLILLLAVIAPLAGCGAPPDLPAAPEGPLPGSPSPESPTAPAPASPTPPSATRTPSGASTAVACAGQPGPEAVLALLRDDDLLAEGAEASVVEGPLCAGDWQFTVVRVADRDPLQVITSGPPDDLTLVTAGTDVCTIEVRVHAPAGIRIAAGCVG